MGIRDRGARTRAARRTVCGLALAAAAIGVALGVGSAGASGAATTPGVTKSTITLGLDVAQSGLAAPTTVPFVQGIQTFWGDQNYNHHGVCGRKVSLAFADNGGDPQTELTAFTSLENKVLAIQQVSPSAGLLGLLSQLQSQQILFSSSSTVNLFNVPEYYALGTDFGHAVVDTTWWLMQHRGLKKGDTIALLYGTGPYATEANLGAQFAASTYGLKLVSSQLAASDTDMTAAIQSFKSSGAKFVIMVALTPQDFDAVSAGQAAGYSPTWIAASFLSTALTTSIAPVVESNKFLVMGNGGNVSTSDLSGKSAGVKTVIQAYRGFFHAAPTNAAVVYGYAQAMALEEIITKACGKGNTLTRASMVKALGSIKTLNTNGLLPPLNYSQHKANVPPTVQIYLSSVSASALGSLKPATGYFSSPAATKLNLNGN
jgi:ABC-type branched-subunit amino acid transport system substrate-binding protein